MDFTHTTISNKTRTIWSAGFFWRLFGWLHPSNKKEALRIVSGYKTGPLFTPVSVYNPPNQNGTMSLPDATGGATGREGYSIRKPAYLYVSSSTILRPMSLDKAPELSDMDYVAFIGSSKIGPYGLPLVKPPYGRITAIDLNTGNHKWMVCKCQYTAMGQRYSWVERKRHSCYRYPGSCGDAGNENIIVCRRRFRHVCIRFSGGNKLRSYDKATGTVIAEFELPC